MAWVYGLVWTGLEAPGCQKMPPSPQQVLPGGGRAVGTAAGTSLSGLPRGLAPSASLPCWTATQRVTYPSERPTRLLPVSHRSRGGRPHHNGLASSAHLMAVRTSMTQPPYCLCDLLAGPSHAPPTTCPVLKPESP